MENQKDRIKKVEASVWGFFLRKRPIAFLLVIAIILFGSNSIITIPKELQPEVTIPFGVVATALPGANPLDTENLLTKPIEKEVAKINNIKNLSSSSSFGSSTIMIEFEAEADLEIAIQDLKEAVDRAKPNLPDDATDPMVIKAEANDYPIISFSIIGEKSLSELTAITEYLQDELEKVKGISEVSLLGGQYKNIEITLDEAKVSSFNLSIQDISNIIKYSNNNLPLGIIQTDQKNYSIRVDNQYKSLNDIKDLPILSIPGEPPTTIYLKDIAKIEESYPDLNSITKLSTNKQQSTQAVSLTIYKKNGANITEVADLAREKVEELQTNKSIPSDIIIKVSNDNSEFIRKDLGTLTRNGIQTTILIIIILFLALGLKEGLIAGLAIPLSFLISFTVMKLTGMTINSLSLFSLVIALGLMVDTAIVIMEGIHENIKEGFTPYQAGLLSIDTYKYPLIAGTLTTIFAFFPMLLVSGILGEFLRTLPITISATLFASLFIALTIEPTIASKFIKANGNKNKKSILEPFFEKTGDIFYKLIKKILNKKSLRIYIILTSLVLFSLSLALPVTGILKVEMFPQTDTDYFYIDIQTPKGTTLENTDTVSIEIEKILLTIPEIDNFLITIGQSSTSLEIGSTGPSVDSNLGNITINLYPSSERERRSYEISEELRTKFKNFTKAKVNIVEISEGPPSDAPITAKITGTDLNILKSIAEETESILSKIPNTTNINNSLNEGLNEFVYTLDKEKLTQHGISSAQVSMTIRNIIQGINSTEVTLNDEDIDIIVKYDTKDKLSISEIENFEINSPKGYKVTLAELGTYEILPSTSIISREDQKRIIKVSSEINKIGNALEMTEKFQSEVNKIDLPQGYEISFAGDTESIKESFNELYISMLVGILLIAFTLVLMFNSFRQPMIILFTLPLALIGVFPGLYLIGIKLSFPSFLGVVALSGIVVNDAIVLIDRINQNRKKHKDLIYSISEAAKARMQPIFMTSITTIVGILPLAITDEFWGGLGFALVFGLAFSTILTLIVMPVLYYSFESRRAKKQGELV